MIYTYLYILIFTSICIYIYKIYFAGENNPRYTFLNNFDLLSIWDILFLQPSQSSVENELATFRARWQQELLAQPPVKEQLPTKQPVLKSKISCEDGSEESIARAYFLKGMQSNE